jgi:inosine/xanthosine triphosphatase
MTDIIVASANPAKIAAVSAAFEQMFPQQHITVSGITANSGVAAQPMSSDETLQGAINRVADASRSNPGADYYVGIEAGLDGPFTFAWIVIKHQQKLSKSRSASFMLPPEVLKAITAGQELGDIMDTLFKQQNIKQQGGAIGLLTAGKLTRSAVYHQALILAMIPFLNTALYD